MKTTTLKTISAVASLLALVGATSPAFATSTGLQNLGAPGNAVDTWTFVCPIATAQVRVRVFDNNPFNNLAAQVQVAFGEDGNPTLQVTDPTEGGAPSVWANNNVDGPGLYNMAIKKTAGGNEAYIAQAECLNVVGAIFNPVLTLRINQ